jgi:hypothetical protein
MMDRKPNKSFRSRKEVESPKSNNNDLDHGLEQAIEKQPSPKVAKKLKQKETAKSKAAAATI